MKRKGIMLLVAFIIWTIVIQIVDVQQIGVNGTEVGFATINNWFHNLTGTNMSIYTITDWMGIIPLLVCGVFGGIGFTQFVQRRRLSLVDRDIIFLGIYYVIVVFFFVLFEMFPINYRPVLIEGVMEASYPSSTTLLVLGVMPTLVFQVKRRTENVIIKKTVSIFTTIFLVFMVMGRLISGVHWITDIVGSILLSAGLFNTYKAVVLFLCEKEN